MKFFELKALLFVAITIMLLISPGCKDDIAFEAEHKTTIDTMFLNRKSVMEQEIDSLCFISQDDFYQTAFDSIMSARIAQIERQLEAAKAKNELTQ